MYILIVALYDDVITQNNGNSYKNKAKIIKYEQYFRNTKTTKIFREKYIAQNPDSASNFDGILWVDSPSQAYPANPSVFQGMKYCCYPKNAKQNVVNDNGKEFCIQLNVCESPSQLSEIQAEIVYNTIDSYKKSSRYSNTPGQHKYYQGIYEMSKEDFLKICAPEAEKRETVQEKEKRDPEKQDPEKQDPEKQDPEKQDPEKQDPEKQKEEKKTCLPYKFVIFDEMNLARVEYYLADILSAMELMNNSGRSKSGGVRLELGPNKEEVVGWRDDIFILGTANMDETTYSFSPKVLDRCFYIRYSGNDINLQEEEHKEEDAIKEAAKRFSDNKNFFVRSNCFKKLLDEKKSNGWPSNSLSINGNHTINNEIHSIPFALAAALATKGFVILGGLSGAGKTRISRLFAESVLTEFDDAVIEIEGEKLTFRNPLILSVRPDWRDGSSVIGYYNAITNKRKETPFSEMLRIVNRCNLSKNSNGNYEKNMGSMLLQLISKIVSELLTNMNVSKFKIAFGHRVYHEIAAFIYNYLLMRGYETAGAIVSVDKAAEVIGNDSQTVKDAAIKENESLPKATEEATEEVTKAVAKANDAEENQKGDAIEGLEIEDLKNNEAFKDALSWAVVMKMLPKFHGSKESIDAQLKTLKDLLENKYYLNDKTRAMKEIAMLRKELEENDYAIYA